MKFLTPRELDVMDSLVNGWSITEVARMQGVGPQRISMVLSRVKEKLGAATTFQAIAFYVLNPPNVRAAHGTRPRYQVLKEAA